MTTARQDGTTLRPATWTLLARLAEGRRLYGRLYPPYRRQPWAVWSDYAPEERRPPHWRTLMSLRDLGYIEQADEYIALSAEGRAVLAGTSAAEPTCREECREEAKDGA
jgi:hypothetical protein